MIRRGGDGGNIRFGDGEADPGGAGLFDLVDHLIHGLASEPATTMFGVDVDAVEVVVDHPTPQWSKPDPTDTLAVNKERGEPVPGGVDTVGQKVAIMSCARLLDRGGIDHSPVGTLEKERNDPLIQKRRGVGVAEILKRHSHDVSNRMRCDPGYLKSRLPFLSRPHDHPAAQLAGCQEVDRLWQAVRPPNRRPPRLSTT